MASDNRRILIIDNSRYTTGASKSIGILAINLREECEFFYASPIKPTYSSYKEVFIINFLEIRRDFSFIIYLPKLLYNTLKLIRIIRKNKIGAIHVNDLYNMTGVCIKLIYPKIKLIQHVRLLPTSYIRPLFYFFSKIVLRYADKVLCVSKAVFNALPASNKKLVIYNAILAREDYPTMKYNPLTTVRIVCLGNIIPGKGQDLVIDAFHLALKKRDNISLCIIGGTNESKKNTVFKSSLKEKIDVLRIQDYISFQPFTSDIEKEIKNADIIINLSESESFSRVCLEALYYGTPLIASDCGGPRELFENGKSGILVPNKDIDAAAEAILLLAENAELRKSLSEEGKKYVRQKFDPVKLSKQLEKVYKELLTHEG